MSEYHKMTVADLRKAAKERNLGTGMQRAGASKETLVSALECGSWPAEAPRPALPAGPEALAQLATLLAALVPPSVTEEQVRAIAEEAVSEVSVDEEKIREIARSVLPQPRVLRFSLPEKGEQEIPLEGQHERFPLMLACLSVGLNCMLVGPAGSGKTTAARNAAEALGLPFYALSVGLHTTKGDIIGVPTADGGWRDTTFLKAYRDGGLMLLDEMDRGSAAALCYLNMAVDGDLMPVGDKMVPRHPDFRLVAGANTYGTGASRQYVGANQLDAATLDRFAVIEWNYDENLEASMLGLPAAKPSDFDLAKGGTMDTAAWFNRVRSVRASIEAQKVRAIVGPRTSKAGAALLAAGVGRHWVEESVLWRGMDAEARNRVEGGAR